MRSPDNILEGPPYERTVFLSLGELFYMTLKAHSDAILQVDCSTNQQQSAQLLLNQSICLAKWLQSNGIGPGKYVAISSENRLEFAVIAVATFLSGSTFTAFNPDYTEAELEHIFGLTRPSTVFYTKKSKAVLERFVDKLTYVKTSVYVGSEKDFKQKCILLNDILKDVADSVEYSDDFVPTAVNPDETVALVLYSSGTSGLPKGVMLSHYNITAMFEILSIYLQSDPEFVERQGTTFIGIAPYFHALGFFTLLIHLLRGYKHLVMSSFQPKLFLDTITKYKLAYLGIPPPLWNFLIKHPLTRKYDLSHLKIVAGGGAPITAELEEGIRKRFSSVGLTSQAYGLTETTLGVIFPPIDRHKLGSPGKLLPGIKAKVINEEGVALPPNQPGELCFKGPVVMLGYISNPEATRAAIDSEGYLHTGDIGYYDDEEYFFVLDRKKELIKYKGFQVAPAELESLLTQRADVAEAAVIGIPDDDAGELPVAFVVKMPSAECTAAEIECYVAENVSSAKRLRGGVYFVDGLPKTGSGKVLRRVLKEKALKLRSKL